MVFYSLHRDMNSQVILVWLASVFLVPIPLVAAESAESPPRPNIVLIIADDKY